MAKFKYYQYQKEVIDKSIDELNEVDRACVVSATGTGKTVMIYGVLEKYISINPDAKIAVTAHRLEIINNLKDTLVEFKTNTDFVSIQKLSRIAKESDGKVYDLLIIDEAHHIPAKSYREVMDVLAYKVLGFTATPIRGLIPDYPEKFIDRNTFRYECTGILNKQEGTGELFDRFIYGYSTKQAINEGFLTLYTIIYGREFHIEQAKTGLHEYTESEVNDSLTISEAAKYVNETIENKKAILFMHSIAYAEKINTELNIKSVVITSKTKKKERDKFFTDFKNGEIQALVGVDIFSEGVDVPAVDCVYLFRPTRSIPTYFQQIGRALRKHEGKTEAIVYDYVGNKKRLGIEPNEMILEQMALSGKISKKICSICGAFGESEANKDSYVGGAKSDEVRYYEDLIRRFYSRISIKVGTYGKKLVAIDYKGLDEYDEIELKGLYSWLTDVKAFEFPVVLNSYGRYEMLSKDNAQAAINAYKSVILTVPSECRFDKESNIEHYYQLILKNLELETKKERKIKIL